MPRPRHEHPADDAVVRSFADTVDSLWTEAANRSITELDWLEHVKDALYVEHAARTGLAQGAAAEWNKALAATHAFTEAYAPLRVRLGKLDGAIGAVLGGWRTQMPMAPLSRLVHVADAVGRAGCSRMLLDLLLDRASRRDPAVRPHHPPAAVARTLAACTRPGLGVDAASIWDPTCGTGQTLVEAHRWRRLATPTSHATYSGDADGRAATGIARGRLALADMPANIRNGLATWETRRHDAVLAVSPGRWIVPSDDADDRALGPLDALERAIDALRPGGRAALVLPDWSLSGPGVAESLSSIARQAHIHTVLWLPREALPAYPRAVAVFVAATHGTRTAWAFDARANVPPADTDALADQLRCFERCYGADPNGFAPRRESDAPPGRWRPLDPSALADLGAARWLEREDPEPPPLDLDGLGSPYSRMPEWLADWWLPDLVYSHLSDAGIEVMSTGLLQSPAGPHQVLALPSLHVRASDPSPIRRHPEAPVVRHVAGVLTLGGDRYVLVMRSWSERRTGHDVAWLFAARTWDGLPPKCADIVRRARATDG